MSNKNNIMMYIVSWLLADVEARKPALKASGHEVADRRAGSLFHCLSGAGKKEW